MSDGGAESRPQIPMNRDRAKTRVDDFPRAIARIAVAQICETRGFQGSQQCALDMLSDVALRYIREIGKTASYYANFAGRSQSNVLDVNQALEDVGSAQGFSGASDVNRCLLSSGTVREIFEYVAQAEQMPFAYSISGFPLAKERAENTSFAQRGVNPPSEHIPAWLPAFPDPETYRNHQVRNTKDVDSRVDNVEQTEKQERSERPIPNWQLQFMSNGSDTVMAFDVSDAGKARSSVESNRFLAAPLQLGEKEVSAVTLPARFSDETFLHHQNHGHLENHVSLLETFSPAIEAVKSRQHDEDSQKKILSDRGSALKFKFTGGRKFIGFNKTHVNAGAGIGAWFSSDDRKDDKTRKAEQILKNCMESAEDFTQL